MMKRVSEGVCDKAEEELAGGSSGDDMLDDVAEPRSNFESVFNLPRCRPRLGNVGFVLVGHDPGELLRVLDAGADEMAVGEKEHISLVDVVLDEMGDERVFPDEVAVEEGAVDGVA